MHPCTPELMYKNVCVSEKEKQPQCPSIMNGNINGGISYSGIYTNTS